MRKLIPFMMLSLVVSACNSESWNVGEEVGIVDGEEAGLVEVLVSTECGTRTEEDLKIALLVSRDGEETFCQRVSSVESHTDDGIIRLMIGDGVYTLFALCGLEDEELPKRIEDIINIKEGTDFAAGIVRIEICGSEIFRLEEERSKVESVRIEANRQMSWIETRVEKVPREICSARMMIQGKSGQFALTNLLHKDVPSGKNLDRGWHYPDGKNAEWTEICLERTASGTFEGGKILCPMNGEVQIVLEGQTAVRNEENGMQNGSTSCNKLFYNVYESDEGLRAGVHLEQILSFNFKVGERYIGLPGTIVGIANGGRTLHVMAHKPLRVTLEEVRHWDMKHVPYNLTPEIEAVRWAFPQSSTIPANVIKIVQKNGIAAFGKEFASVEYAGQDSSNPGSLRVLGYYDMSKDRFYSYNLTTMKSSLVEDDGGEYLVFPIGIVEI